MYGIPQEILNNIEHCPDCQGADPYIFDCKTWDYARDKNLKPSIPEYCPKKIAGLGKSSKKGNPALIKAWRALTLTEDLITMCEAARIIECRAKSLVTITNRHNVQRVTVMGRANYTYYRRADIMALKALRDTLPKNGKGKGD